MTTRTGDTAGGRFRLAGCIPWRSALSTPGVRHIRVNVQCVQCGLDGLGMTIRAAVRDAAHTSDECRSMVYDLREADRHTPQLFGGAPGPGDPRIHESMRQAWSNLTDVLRRPGRPDLADVPTLANEVEFILRDASSLLERAADTITDATGDVVMVDGSDEDPAYLARKTAEAFRAAAQVDTNQQLLEYAGAGVARLGYASHPSPTAPEGDHL